ncbi:MAG: thiamine/thiamine pyrophosphate ABC transporter, permease protein [Acidiferrobacteraceae bacterium]|nr:thiamine/thiamine pyrophosphate ABC transporter, permease protein [Acidiferrobacteraceae bacterium]
MGNGMARGIKQITLKSRVIIFSLWPGILGALSLLLLIGSTLAVLLRGSDALLLINELRNDSYIHRVAIFSIWQAVLSTVLSVGIAIPVARAFARQQDFIFRDLLLKLLGLPVVTPIIVAIFGIIAVYGQSGLVRATLEALGVSWNGNFYGLTGILVTHVFFNLPLAIRMLVPAWERIPSENWRLAGQLGMNTQQIFRWLEWPALTGSIPGVSAIIFLLCFSSFAVVLVLGGGPSATTIEVAIYQALRFQFDPAQAALLAMLQISICTIIVLILHRWIRVQPVYNIFSVSTNYRPDLISQGGRRFDLTLIYLTCSFVMLPLLAVIYYGLTGPILDVLLERTIWAATTRSIIIAIASTIIALLLSIALLTTSRELLVIHKNRGLSDLFYIIGSIVLVVSPIVVGTGLFLLLLPIGINFDAAMLVIILVNAALVLPYIIRTVGPALLDAGLRYDKLCRNLAINRWNRLRLVDWPIIRRPLSFALGLSASLSLGDLGVAALFNSAGAITLPVLVYYQLSAYRFDEAAVTALLLIFICAMLFVIIDKGLQKWHS